MAKRSEIQLVLVSGARSEWDDLGRLQGKTDLPMSAAGAESLTALVELLEGDPVERVLTAPDEACVMTARAIARKKGLRAKSYESLAAVGLGLWEGMEASQALDRYPKVYRQWRSDPLSVVPPDGEPLDQAAQRIVKGLCKTLDKSAKTVTAVVLRPTALAIVESWLTGEPIGESWPPDTRRDVVRQSLMRDRLHESPSLRVMARTL